MTRNVFFIKFRVSMYVYIMRSNDDREETNSKTSSEGYEEQRTFPAETSSDDSTKPSGAADDKKKVIVVTPSSTKAKDKATDTNHKLPEEGKQDRKSTRLNSSHIPLS